MSLYFWMIFAVVFAVLFIFWKPWRAFTVCLAATALLSVFMPIIGAALVLPILGLGLVVSICCLIADEKQKAAFEEKFTETITEASEEKKNEEER